MGASGVYHANQAVSKGRSPTSRISRLLEAASMGAVLGFTCLISFFLITAILGRSYFVSRDDEPLGGMWSVIATIFVYRHIYQQSARAIIMALTSRSEDIITKGITTAVVMVVAGISPQHAKTPVLR